MGLDSLCVRRVVVEVNCGLKEKFLKERVHGLKAVGVTSIISEQDVMFQKENVVFPAIEENQPVLAKFVIGSEIFAKQGAARFCDDVVFHVDHDLRHLLSHAANDAPPGGLHLRQTCFDDVRLLAALKMLAALANPFLAFENKVGKLIAHFEGQKFQQAQPEEQVDLYIFDLRNGQSICQPYSRRQGMDSRIRLAN